MSYVPDSWYSAKYKHNLGKYHLGWFRTVHTCSCGASGRSFRQLWHAHVQIEIQLAHAMKIIEEKRAKRWRTLIDAEKAQGRQQRLPNSADSGTLHQWDIK